jgi:hypothetical protein
MFFPKSIKRDIIKFEEKYITFKEERKTKGSEAASKPRSALYIE